MNLDDLGEVPMTDAELSDERAVLGSAVRFPGAFEEASAILRAEMFRVPAHRLLFDALTQMSSAGRLVALVPESDSERAVDLPGVLAELTRTGAITRLGMPDAGTGGVYLHTLMASWGSVAASAPRVREAWRARNLRASLLSAFQVACDPAFDPAARFDRVRELVVDATTDSDGMSALRSQAEIIAEALDHAQSGIAPGLATGFPELDDVIGGMRPGEMTVIGARPGAGKTTLGLNIADYVATDLGVPVLFASLEMSAEQLAYRRIAATARVPLHNLIRHCVTEREWDLIATHQGRLTGSELLIDDGSGQSLASIRGRLQLMERVGTPAGLMVADYAGLFDGPQAENRQVFVSAVAKGVRQIAREWQIPVLLLAQLNRGPMGRSDKVPQLSDLRESGALEQDADVVLLLHREDCYERESARAGEIDVIVAKNRQGPQATVTLAFQGHYGRMVSMASSEASAVRVRGGGLRPVPDDLGGAA